ncbi:MAG TPA: AMP-binding protein [Nocardioidaceae bacterium]|nr:AMP-binding protein [Nocardioidaceae bacterium]
MTSASATQSDGYTPLSCANVADLVRLRAADRPNDTALVEAYGEHRAISWGELENRVDRCARALAELGLVTGNRVAIAMINSVDFVTAYLGALRAGLTAVPANPRSATGELMRMLADSGSLVVVADRTTATVVRSAVAGLEDALRGADDDLRSRSNVPRIVLADGATIGAELSFDALLSGDGRPIVSPADAEALALLLYTSGTSGRPRGAMLTHRALLANVAQTAAIEPAPMRADDVVLGLLPLFHVYGLNCVLGQVLAQGARLVLLDHFDADATLDLVGEHGITNLPIAPPVIAAWAGRDDLRDKLSGVRFVLSGAAPLDADLADEFESAAGVVVHQGYGLTEAAPVVTSTLTATGGAAVPGSVGGAIPGVEIEVRDASGRPVAGDDPAQVWVRGDNLFSGYWPDGVDGPDDDGWYATGDIGVIAREGDLVLVDRLRELVIVSGFNVYPTEVEEVIAEVAGVAESAVIGTPDEETGEAVHAFIVATDSEASSDDLVDAVRTHCETRLARFKWPRRITVVEGLPHSATGKVAKGRLRAQARRDVLGLG